MVYILPKKLSFGFKETEMHIFTSKRAQFRVKTFVKFLPGHRYVLSSSTYYEIKTETRNMVQVAFDTFRKL